jgi:hypothetical protein
MFELLLVISLPFTQGRHTEALATALLGLLLLMLSAALQQSHNTVSQSNQPEHFVDDKSNRLGEEAWELQPSLLRSGVVRQQMIAGQLSPEPISSHFTN